MGLGAVPVAASIGLRAHALSTSFGSRSLSLSLSLSRTHTLIYRDPAAAALHRPCEVSFEGVGLSLRVVQFSSQFLDILPRYWNEKIETQVLWRKTTTTTTATIRYKRLNRCMQQLVPPTNCLFKSRPPPFLPKNGRNAEPDFCCHNFGLKRYILSKWVFSSLPLLALVREIEGVLSEIMCGLFPARSEFKWLRWGVPNRRFKVGRSRWTTAKQIWNVSMHVLHKFFHNLTNATAYHLGWYSCSSTSTKQLHDWGNIFHSIAIIFWAENKIRNDKEAISRWRHFPRIDLESE